MCGIVGIITKKEKPTLGFIKSLSNQIKHRGPDAEGYYINENIAFGHRRLSIIDLSTGDQPMSNNDGSIVIAFNGEIYNYRTLKQQLSNDYSIIFNTNSDTEVILKGYEVWGNKVVDYLNGMFVFSIHDKTKNKVFIARDRFGEKPLYYHNDQEKIVWASELKSIISDFPELKKISKPALNLFLSLTYIPAPFTIYENIYKLKPGHFLEIDTQNLLIKETEYWNIDLSTSVDLIDYKKAKQELKSLFIDTVKNTMISDVPLGVFLSGGVDSTIIAAIMSQVSETPIKTFSVGYSNPKYDESQRARLIAQHIKSEHHEYLLDYNEILPDLDKILLNYDEPYADSSCLPTYYISKKTVDHVKVALTGDGGDEVFGGYNKYLIHTYGKIYQRLVPGFLNTYLLNKLTNINIGSFDSKSPISKVKKLLKSIGNTTAINHLNIISLGFQNSELHFLLHPEVFQNMQPELLANLSNENQAKNKKSPLKLARYLDIHISLEGDLLPKVDRASMLCSLECRAPFLNHKLMELSYRMPDKFLIKGNKKKRILKDTFAYLLPKDFFNSPKSGFEVPISDWFRNELKDDLLITLSENNINKHNYFNFSYIEKLIQQHINQGIDQSVKLWTLFCFQKWYNHNFD